MVNYNFSFGNEFFPSSFLHVLRRVKNVFFSDTVSSVVYSAAPGIIMWHNGMKTHCPVSLSQTTPNLVIAIAVDCILANEQIVGDT